MEILECEATFVESVLLDVSNVFWECGMKGLSSKSNALGFDTILLAFMIAISFSPWSFISLEAVSLCHYPMAGCAFGHSGVVEVQTAVARAGV